MSVQHKELSGAELHQSMPKGNDADKSASPVVGDWYLATDTEKLYVCYADGVWEEFGSDSAVLKDADNDTKIEVEKTTDEDKVRVTTAGTERAVIDSNGLMLESGASVNEFSTDGTLAGDSDDAVPTEKAVKAYCDALDTSPADGSISTAKLKTSTGTVSQTSTSATGCRTLLPGGEYGFYPQTHGRFDGNDNAPTCGVNTGTDSGSYQTTVAMRMQGGYTGYAKQRYVTASGQDYWAFMLVEITSGDIVSTYCAPDHPCYGHGGDIEKVPHPFDDFDESKYEVVLLDKASAEKIRIAECPSQELVDNYKISGDGVYEPIHTGKFVDGDPELVETLVMSIKVKIIKKYTIAEKTVYDNCVVQLRQVSTNKREQQKKIDDQKHLMAVDALKAKGDLPRDYEDEVTLKVAK